MEVNRDAEILRLKEEGKTFDEIAAKMECSRSTVVRRLRQMGRPARPHNRSAALNPDAVTAFFESKTEWETHKIYNDKKFPKTENRRKFGGIRPSESDLRNITRWREGSDNPSLWGLDKVLTRLEMHVEQYFDFCEEKGLNPWKGDKPEWAP